MLDCGGFEYEYCFAEYEYRFAEYEYCFAEYEYCFAEYEYCFAEYEYCFAEYEYRFAEYDTNRKTQPLERSFSFRTLLCSSQNTNCAFFPTSSPGR
jgi:hypothetical protein